MTLNVASPIRLRLIARESAISYLGTLGMLVLGLATKILLARALTSGDYGLLIIAQTLVGLGLTLMNYSVPDAVVRFVGLSAGHNMAKAKGVVASALQFGLALTALPVLGLLVGAGWIAEHIYQQAALAGALTLSVVAMPFTMVAEVLAAAYRGISQIWVKGVLLDLGRALWVVVGIGLLIALNASSLLTVVGVYTAAAVAAAALTMTMFARSRHWRVERAPAPISDLLHYSWPLMGSSLVIWPMAAIPLTLGSAVSAQAVAYYSLSVTIANLLYMPTGAIDTAALPIWSDCIARGDIASLRAGYASATRWCLIAALAIFGPLALCPVEILDLIYGADYRAAASVVQVVAMVFLLNAATGPNEGILRAFGYTRQIFLAHLVGGGGALAAAVVLIPAWGMTGALAALGVSTVLVLGVDQLSLFFMQGIHPFDASYFKIILAGLLAIMLTSFLQGYLSEWVWKIAYSSLLYNGLFIIFLSILRVLRLQDWKLIRRALPTIK